MPLISVSKLTKSYGTRVLFDQISFSVNEGDKIALIGNNGTGKTTIFRIIAEKENPDSGSAIRHAGVISGFLSQDLADLSFSDSPIKSREIEMLEGELHNLTQAMSAASGDELSDLMRRYEKAMSRYESAGGYDYEHRIKEVLAGLGLLSSDLERPVSSFSGGERMRVALARLVVQAPDVLLLDEPTNHLDTAALSWLESFLRSYKGAVLFISHDRYFIDQVANRVLDLEGGRLKGYKGNYSHYYKQKEEYIRDQQRIIAGLQKDLERQEQVTQTMLSHRKMSSYHSREKRVAKLADVLREEKAKIAVGSASMNFSFTPKEEVANKDQLLLQVEDVTFGYAGKNSLFANVSFEQKATEKIFLTGPNGCGKTTFLSLLLGKLPDFSGSILVKSHIQFGYMGQFVPFEDETREVLDELYSRSDLSQTEARSLLARFGFRDVDVYKKIQVLSGGERSRLFLCCLLQENPDILFLDEPTNHLDITSREILENSLREYPGAILAVSHDRFFIDKCADRILGFGDGGILPFYRLQDYLRYLIKKESRTISKPGKETQKKSPKTLDSTSGKTPGRAEERRRTALRKERIRAIEKELEELEKEQEALQTSFSPASPLEDYHRFDENQKKLSILYDEYIDLEEKSS